MKLETQIQTSLKELVDGDRRKEVMKKNLIQKTLFISLIDTKQIICWKNL